MNNRWQPITNSDCETDNTDNAYLTTASTPTVVMKICNCRHLAGGPTGNGVVSEAVRGKCSTEWWRQYSRHLQAIKLVFSPERCGESYGVCYFASQMTTWCCFSTCFLMPRINGMMKTFIFSHLPYLLLEDMQIFMLIWKLISHGVQWHRYFYWYIWHIL